MKPVLATLAIIASTGAAFAQGVPTINIEPSCRASAAADISKRQTIEACRRSELEARATLVKQWSQFPAADRAACHRLTTMGTPGTYTELLTCLELKRDARALPYDRGTIGLGTRNVPAR